MKKNLTRVLAITLASVLMIATIAACRNDDSGVDAFAPPEFIYVPESVPLPEDISDISNLAFLDGRVYFTSTTYDYNEETYEYHNETSIYSMNPDGSDLTKLPDYSSPIDVPDNASGGIYVRNMTPDSEGNFWIMENYDYSIFNLPDNFDPERDMLWEYAESLGSGTVLRKLSGTGAELSSVDLTAVTGQNSASGQQVYIYTFGVDSAGNIYLCTEDMSMSGPGGRTIVVLDSSGNKLFDLKTESWFEEFILTPDGAIAFTEDIYSETGRTRSLRKIDVANKSLGEAIDLPDVGYYFYNGSGGYDVLIGDNDNVYGFTFGEEEAVKILNWMDSDIINNQIENMTMTADGQILCSQYNYNRFTGAGSQEVLILTKTPYSELPEKTLLTLAAVGTWNIRDAVVAFNKASNEYRVQVIDYSQFNTEDDYNAGMTRLSAEIIAGQIPDILVISDLPYGDYVSRGLLIDLYPLLDADPDYSREDFLQNALHAAEIDGKLYQIFSSFDIFAMVGHPDVVGKDMGWTLDEFKSVLNDNPNADMPLGQSVTKTQFLQALLTINMDKFIDWGSGEANFESSDFIELMEFSNTLPEDIDYDNISGSWEDFWLGEEEAIATGRQIMSTTGASDFYQLSYYRSLFGGDYMLKSFPSSDGEVSFNLISRDGLAISAKSDHPDGAWQFVRTILSKEYQQNIWEVPTNKEAFDAKAAEALAMEPGSYGYNNIMIDPPTQEDVSNVLAAIDNAQAITTGMSTDPMIWDIISEEITPYFAGTRSAQDTASVIQSRVSRLVSERS